MTTNLKQKAEPPHIQLEIVQVASQPATSPLLSPVEYYALLRNLVREGVSAAKKSNIVAFPLRNLCLTTLNNAGGHETQKEFVYGHQIVFDGTLYDVPQARAVCREIFIKYAELITGDSSNNNFELCVTAAAEGVWSMTNKNFANDYEKMPDPPFTYRVKEGSGRICLPIRDKDFTMPVTWGDFRVRENGAIAIRWQEIGALVEALRDIQSGTASIEKALYTSDAGKTLAKFDIYGMDPGFYDANYNPATAPTRTSRALDNYRKPQP